MSVKNLLIISIATVLAFILGVLIYFQSDKAEIETLSATVIPQAEDIITNSSGTIKEIAVQNNEQVKFGQLLFTYETNVSKKCITNDSSENLKDSEEYEKAALMYKDGIISKNEYDEIIEKYKTKSNVNKTCKNNANIVKLYAKKDGMVSFDSLKIGTYVEKDTIIAKIYPHKRSVLAYFSPKYIKKLKDGTEAKISVVRYPEKTFSGNIKSVNKIEIKGIPVIIEIKDDISNLTIEDNDHAIVVIKK